VNADYDESWGKTLGPTTQWRCKLCPDGIGESADIVCADAWDTDEKGYPVFTEGEGVSALIARTSRGQRVIEEAARSGAISLMPLDVDHLTEAQPLQVTRRRFLLARLIGSRLAGRGTPRFRGFGLSRWILFAPREAIRTVRGTYRRVRRYRAEGR
jgi:coenzyme F420 hydrogenase subunit beta